jgi:hypothetical protein
MLVIYRKSPDGKITIKGRATISKVYDTTSMALIASQDERLAEGDLFTTETQWGYLQGISGAETNRG